MIKLKTCRIISFQLNGSTMLKIFTFITQHQSPEQFLLQIKTIVSEVLFLMMEIVQLYYLSHKPILQGLENGRQNAKDFSMADGYYATSTVVVHMIKLYLITYLSTQYGLLSLLQVVHNFCVNQPILWQWSCKVQMPDGVVNLFAVSICIQKKLFFKQAY